MVVRYSNMKAIQEVILKAIPHRLYLFVSAVEWAYFIALRAGDVEVTGRHEPEKWRINRSGVVTSEEMTNSRLPHSISTRILVETKFLLHIWCMSAVIEKWPIATGPHYMDRWNRKPWLRKMGRYRITQGLCRSSMITCWATASCHLKSKWPADTGAELLIISGDGDLTNLTTEWKKMSKRKLTIWWFPRLFTPKTIHHAREKCQWRVYYHLIWSSDKRLGNNRSS